MRAAFKGIIGKAAETGGKLVLQITVSVTATVCVAAITNTYLGLGRNEEAAAPQALASAEPHHVASLLNANFIADGFRARVASVDEFAAVFGPTDDLPYSPPLAREWSNETVALKSDNPVQATPRQVVASACLDACSHLPAIGILPPARPVVAQAAQAAQAAVSSAEVSEGRSIEILGVSLPSLVPLPGRILTTVTSWGGSVADLVLR
ncbi:hypothetical protein HPT29_008710 [Microvirga terrae]|uniref:MacB-like periplasmic core domain-containing protein n=1 Tax=Microvirga terrae TaxID=2740529 RepID=A0ABY5RV93_9HYPH|nr:hypothetical protein [Microvirga terrae]UVF21185.1 hypothetical protein HPT29_008710 [Microvirga terrae]